MYSAWFAVIVPGAVGRLSLTASRERFDRRCFEYAEHVAQPDRRTEPPFALRICALEFWIYDESGLGGR